MMIKSESLVPYSESDGEEYVEIGEVRALEISEV